MRLLLQVATQKGTARAWDHCQVVHEVWTQALVNKTWVWVERVPSDDNIADFPSREEYGLLRDMGAVWREPVVAQAPDTAAQAVLWAGYVFCLLMRGSSRRCTRHAWVVS